MAPAVLSCPRGRAAAMVPRLFKCRVETLKWQYTVYRRQYRAAKYSYINSERVGVTPPLRFSVNCMNKQ